MMRSALMGRSCVGAKAEKGVMLRIDVKDTYLMVMTTWVSGT